MMNPSEIQSPVDIQKPSDNPASDEHQTPAEQKKKQRVSLVLGSGGAKGIAHVGIIHWLEEHGYDIVSISGCSVGAVVGGLYAAGKLAEFEEWVRSITKYDVVSLVDIAWQRSGLVKGDKIVQTLTRLVGKEQLIETLPIKFTAVAADILNEKEVWLQSGSLFDAIRASISLPLFFTPVKYNGSYLVDGGVLNPVPIAPTFGDVSDLTIAVNLGGSPVPEEELRPPPEPETAPPQQESAAPDPEEEGAANGFRDSISRFVQRVQHSLVSSEPTEKTTMNWGPSDVANLAFETMQGSIARHKLAVYPPDLLVTVPRNACAMFDLHRSAEMIELGYRIAEQQLGQHSHRY